jgi:hypothetical protein
MCRNFTGLLVKGLGGWTRTNDISHPRGVGYQAAPHLVIWLVGFEPTTPCPPDKCATKLRYSQLVAQGSLDLDDRDVSRVGIAPTFLGLV